MRFEPSGSFLFFRDAYSLYYRKEMILMLLFVILAIMVIILTVITVLVIATAGAGFILVFGDVIVCIAIIIIFIIKLIFKRKNKKN